MLQRKRHLDQRRHARRALQMPQVGFHRSGKKRLVTLLAQHFAECNRLDGIPKRGPGAMRFDERYFFGFDPRVRQCFTDECRLSRAVRSR